MEVPNVQVPFKPGQLTGEARIDFHVKLRIIYGTLRNKTIQEALASRVTFESSGLLWHSFRGLAGSHAQQCPNPAAILPL